jgi:hypothetical protein
LFFSIFDHSLFRVYPFSSLLPLVIVEVMQLVTVVYCCKSACFQVGIIVKHFSISFVNKCSIRVLHKLSCVTETMLYEKNTCLCELIRCAGEESFSLYRQISTVKHPQPLIEVYHNSDKSNSTNVHVRKICDCVCNDGDLFNSVFSIHTLVLFSLYLSMIFIMALLKCWMLIRVFCECYVDNGDVYWNSC